MGGYEIEGPSGPPSALERYLFAAAGRPKPRVCCLATASGDDKEFIARFYEVCEALPCIPSPSRVVPRPRRGGSRRVLRRVRRRLRARRQHREHARRCGARTASTACSPTRGPAGVRRRRRERGWHVLVRRGLHDVVRAAHAAARRPRLVRRQLLPARAATGPARCVRGRGGDGSLPRAGPSTTAPRCTSSTVASMRAIAASDTARVLAVDRDRRAPARLRACVAPCCATRRRGRRTGAARRSPRASASTATRSCGSRRGPPSARRRTASSTAPPITIWKSGSEAGRCRARRESASSVAICAAADSNVWPMPSQPSPRRAARRSAAFDSPPTRIGGRGSLHRLRLEHHLVEREELAVVRDRRLGEEQLAHLDRLVDAAATGREVELASRATPPRATTRRSRTRSGRRRAGRRSARRARP